MLTQGAFARGPADADTEAAKRHYEIGRGHYERGDFTAALSEFESARRLKALPALDYNIARCLDRLDRLEEAIAAYKRFALTTPSLKESEEARDSVRVLKMRLEEQRSRPKPPATVAAAPSQTAATPVAIPPAAPRSSPLEPAPNAPAPLAAPAASSAAATTPGSPSARRPSWLLPTALGASALAITITGIGLAGSVGPDYDALKSSCAPSCAPSSWQGLQAREQAGAALLAIGGLALAADAALWIVRAVRERPRRSALILPSGLGLQVAGEF
jgi:hypothetical protein